MSTHHAQIRWRRSSPDFTYESYNRAHELRFGEGLVVPGSAAPEFRGEPGRLDPESAFVSALSACHMLSFLAIAARRRLSVDAYEDDAEGHLEKDGSGKLSVTRVILRPKLVWSDDVRVSDDDILKLHHLAHSVCFIANSVKTEIKVEPRT